MGCSWSSIATAIPLIFAGLSYFPKPILFSHISWSLMVPLLFKDVSYSRAMFYVNRFLRLSFVVFLICAAFLMPIVKFGSLCMEYPASQEIAGTEFLYVNGVNGTYFIYFEDPAWMYSYIVSGFQTERNVIGVLTIYTSEEGLNKTIIETTSIWITYRLLARDTTMTFSPTMFEIIRNVTKILPELTHNQVYDCGWPEYVLVPRLEE